MMEEALPHSGISGSKRARRSPEPYAVRRALHRLLAPRHPPVAHSSLIFPVIHQERPFHCSCVVSERNAAPCEASVLPGAMPWKTSSTLSLLYPCMRLSKVPGPLPTRAGQLQSPGGFPSFPED